MKSRKDGCNKRRLDCEDLSEMFELLDKNLVPLPEFHAVNIHRLPRVAPLDVDNLRMTESIVDLKKQATALTLSNFST